MSDGNGPEPEVSQSISENADRPAPAISVLIVNYNAGPHLAPAVRALAAQSCADFEAIVVDNASSDDSLAAARSAVAGDARFVFKQADANLGFAAGNNLAATMARGTWLALLNPDAVPARDWLDQLIAGAKRHPDTVMFGSTQVDAAAPERLDGAGDHYLAIGLPWRGGYGWPLAVLPAEGEVFSPCAAAALIRADVFRAAAGFDERFFCYVEDVDLAFRLRLQGHRCIQVPSAIVRHVGGASAGKGSAFARRYGTRNLIWCFVKCMPPPLFWPLLSLHLLALLFLFARALANGVARPVWGGIVAALSDMRPIWASRRALQRERRVSSRRIASSLTWNPIVYARRMPRVLGPVGKTEHREGE